MEDFFVIVGVLLLILMIPVLYRTIQGPTVIDRMIGVNIIGTKTMVLLIVTGVIFDRAAMFVDLALTYALLNFIGSVAAAKFLYRPKSAEAAHSESTEA